jgi:hypothetical protein
MDSPKNIAPFSLIRVHGAVCPPESPMGDGRRAIRNFCFILAARPSLGLGAAELIPDALAPVDAKRVETPMGQATVSAAFGVWTLDPDEDQAWERNEDEGREAQNEEMVGEWAVKLAASLAADAVKKGLADPHPSWVVATQEPQMSESGLDKVSRDFAAEECARREAQSLSRATEEAKKSALAGATNPSTNPLSAQRSKPKAL